MTSTTGHRSGGTDDVGPGPGEVTAAIPPVSHPHHAGSVAGAGFPHRAHSAPTWGEPPAPGRRGLGATSATSGPPWSGPTVGQGVSPSSPVAPAGLPAGFAPRQVRPSGMRWGWIVIGVVGAILAVALLVSFAAAQQTMTVQGSATLHVTWSTLSSGSSCTGAGVYSWLQPGTSVTISDANGTIVGTTTLSSGTAYASGSSNYGGYADTCVFPFTLTNVPAGDNFYRVGVGNVAADGVTFTAEQLRTSGAAISYGQ
jgi:hypothetical protein